MNLFHPMIDKLLLLRANATPGVWGPTTSAPYCTLSPITDDNKGFRYGVEGKRGEPAWSAVVSTETRGSGKDHDRYAPADSDFFYEPGTDIYGGTLIGESLFPGNGEYIAAIHNQLPGLTQTIRNLRAMVISVGMSPIIVDQIIAESMEGNDPS
jgi:hypothetical protein